MSSNIGQPTIYSQTKGSDVRGNSKLYEALLLWLLTYLPVFMPLANPNFLMLLWALNILYGLTSGFGYQKKIVRACIFVHCKQTVLVMNACR